MSSGNKKRNAMGPKRWLGVLTVLLSAIVSSYCRVSTSQYLQMISTYGSIPGAARSYHKYRFHLSDTKSDDSKMPPYEQDDSKHMRSLTDKYVLSGLKPKRDIYIWLWHPVLNETSWNEFIERTKQHKDFVTRMIFDGYAIGDNGEFASGGVEWAFRGLVRKYTRRFLEIGVPVTGMIDGGEHSENVITLITSKSLTEKFIADALQEARTYGLSGFNMDVEYGCDPVYTPLYIKFLTDFAKALHANNMTLTYDMGGYCAWIEYMQMNCTLMKEIPLDRILSMDTYTPKLDDWMFYVKTATSALGELVYGAGIFTDTPVLLSKSTLDYGMDVGTQALALWANPPEEEKYWEGLKYFAYRP